VPSVVSIDHFPPSGSIGSGRKISQAIRPHGKKKSTAIHTRNPDFPLRAASSQHHAMMENRMINPTMKNMMNGTDDII
jgi:hypothetical protein